MAALPPDLARLGDELTGAARRAAARRERRRRMAAAIAAGAVAFAALTPASLGPAQRELAFADAAAAAPLSCDRPRGAQFTLAACPRPGVD